MKTASRWEDGEYLMDFNQESYFNEKIDSNYKILDGKIDELRDKFDGKLDKIYDSVSDLKSIVTNGLSHRTVKTEADVDYLKQQMATKQDIATLRDDRHTADEAWKEARRWRIATAISGVSVLASVAYFIWG